MVETYTYCIWYRVNAAEVMDAERQVRSMMARLACRTGIAGQLLKKRDEPLLWMEYYPAVSDTDVFEARLRQALDEYDVGIFIDDHRHTECFIADREPLQGCRPL